MKPFPSVCNAFVLFFLFFHSIVVNGQTASVEAMTNERMGKVLRQEVGSLEGNEGNWQFIYGDQLVMVITDESANRMRIFAPIVEEKDLTNGHMKRMLEANFHSALDAKYCMYEGFAIAVFTHPLRELTSEQLIDATRQVVNLAVTFGTTYQSTDLIFAPRIPEGDVPPRLNKKPAKKS